jgi:hypothetical protein
MKRNRTSHWITAAVAAVVMVSTSAGVASAAGPYRLPVDSDRGDRRVSIGHNFFTTDLGDFRLRLPTSFGIISIGGWRLPVMEYEEAGMPVVHSVLRD